MQVTIVPNDPDWRYSTALDHSYPQCCSHRTSTQTTHSAALTMIFLCLGSWTQAEFLLSGHSMPRTPDGAPLEWHASFLPLDDKFTLGADEPHSKPCRGCVPPPPSPSKPPPASSLCAPTTLSEWHVVGGDEVPLVRQHSQGALEATNPALLPALPTRRQLNFTAIPPSCSRPCVCDMQNCSASCKPPSTRWRPRSPSAKSRNGRGRTIQRDERHPLCP